MKKQLMLPKKAYKEKRSIVDVAHEETGLPIKKLQMLLNPAKLTKGGL
jgi:fumarate hydratase class II